MRSPAPSLRRRFPELSHGLTALVDALRTGLPADRFDVLADALSLSDARVAGYLGIPTSTLARRRKAGRLAQVESERAYRVARLFERAVDVFGSPEAARAWLTQPQYVFGGEVPLRFADTDPGALEVERALGRIEHGVFA